MTYGCSISTNVLLIKSTVLDGKAVQAFHGEQCKGDESEKVDGVGKSDGPLVICSKNDQSLQSIDQAIQTHWERQHSWRLGPLKASKRE